MTIAVDLDVKPQTKQETKKGITRAKAHDVLKKMWFIEQLLNFLT